MLTLAVFLHLSAHMVSVQVQMPCAMIMVSIFYGPPVWRGHLFTEHFSKDLAMYFLLIHNCRDFQAQRPEVLIVKISSYEF